MVWYGMVWCGVAWCGVMWCGVVGWGGVGWCKGRVMVEVGYGRGREGSELSQLGSRWFVHTCY